MVICDFSRIWGEFGAVHRYGEEEKGAGLGNQGNNDLQRTLDGKGK
jgi:hypothetical protein